MRQRYVPGANTPWSQRWLLLLLTAACYTTHPGGELEPIEVVPTHSRPTLEYTAHFDTVILGPASLNEGILEHWKDSGYIASARSVDSFPFTGTADYNLSIDGSKLVDLGIDGLEGFLNLWTLNLIPRTDTYRVRIRYRLENVRTGQRFEAEVRESVKQTWQLFLFLSGPWQDDGYYTIIRAMGDHLYQQLKDAGAFGP